MCIRDSYRQEVAAGAPRASAAAVYGYERLLYAHPSVTAVIAGDAALLPSFRALQVRARPNATQHPPVVFASYRTDVDSDGLVGGADAHKHVASYSSRMDVLVVLGPGRGHKQALSQLLGRWRGRRLVVTGNDELREVVEEFCREAFIFLAVERDERVRVVLVCGAHPAHPAVELAVAAAVDDDGVSERERHPSKEK